MSKKRKLTEAQTRKAQKVADAMHSAGFKVGPKKVKRG